MLVRYQRQYQYRTRARIKTIYYSHYFVMIVDKVLDIVNSPRRRQNIGSPLNTPTSSPPISLRKKITSSFNYSNNNKMGVSLSDFGSMKLAVLVILCLQNSIFTVLRRYSQGVLKETYSKVSLVRYYCSRGSRIVEIELNH